MKKILTILSLLPFLVCSGRAQEFGSIWGKITDADGVALPGVSVTLSGSKIAPRTIVTSEKGNYRFLNLPVSSDYVLKAELQGFKTYLRERLVISYGHDIEINITMEQATLEENITVIGQTPVIDTKKTQVGVNMTEAMIMSLPNARNPWVLMQLAPGMLIDREDVAGAEGGQQSGYYGHGSSSGDATWNIDGADITDNAALGAAPAYLNMASYEEVQINYGNNDIKAMTGGVQLNFVTKRGGNRFSGNFYLDASKKAWQAENAPQELKEQGYITPGVNKIYFYGASFGGPIVTDRAWFYLSYGIQDIGAIQVTGAANNTFLEAAYGKLDFQITSSTRANLAYEYNNKLRWGREAWSIEQHAPETLWDQRGPSPIYRMEIEQIFGNLLLDAKVIYNRNTFYLDPKVSGSDLRTEDGSGPYEWHRTSPSHYVSGNINADGTERPKWYGTLTANYFAENLLGADHEFKFGMEYIWARCWSYSLQEANLEVWERPEWTDMGVREVWLYRDYYENFLFNRYSVYGQDTITLGKFTVRLGLRWDKEKSWTGDVSQPTSPWLPQYLGALTIDRFDPGISVSNLSPRFSLIYDLRGNGKDVLKFNIARYASQTGFEFGWFMNPVPWAEIDVLWKDLNGDSRVTANELFGYDWATGQLKDVNDPNYWLWYGGFDPENPGEVGTLNAYDPNYNTPILDEVSFSYEKELFTDCAARIEFFYKKRHNLIWDKGRFADGTVETADNWFLDGVEPRTGIPYYGRRQWAPGTYRTNAKTASERYTAGQFVFSKRLSNKWMLDASFTLSKWTYHYGDDYNFDLTNREFFDGGVSAPGSWKYANIYVNSPWMLKISGLYQFKWGINVSFTFQGRDGYVILPYITNIYRTGVGWSTLYTNSLSPDIGKFGDTRLPDFYELNLRMEKTFHLTETMAVTVSGDCFNALNNNVKLSAQANLDSPNFGKAITVLNPRVFRFGVRMNF